MSAGVAGMVSILAAGRRRREADSEPDEIPAPTVTAPTGTGDVTFASNLLTVTFATSYDKTYAANGRYFADGSFLDNAFEVAAGKGTGSEPITVDSGDSTVPFMASADVNLSGLPGGAELTGDPAYAGLALANSFEHGSDSTPANLVSSGNMTTNPHFVGITFDPGVSQVIWLSCPVAAGSTLTGTVLGTNPSVSIAFYEDGKTKATFPFGPGTILAKVETSEPEAIIEAAIKVVKS